VLTFSTTPLVFFSLHNDEGCKCDILCKVGIVRIEEEGFWRGESQKKAIEAKLERRSTGGFLIIIIIIILNN